MDLACNPLVHCGEPIHATLAGAALGLVLDYVYPEHRGLLLKLHPVRTAFLAARRLAPPGSGTARGVLAWTAVVASHLAVAWFLLAAARAALGTPGYVAAAAVISKLSMGHRLLYIHVSRVARSLAAGDLDAARREAGMIVRRDTSKLDSGLTASAAVESLFENLVDGYVSPLLYTAALGPLAGFAQRVVNTLDGALGYKTPEYARAGRLSAAADTLANYAPARLYALTVLAAAGALSRRALKRLRSCAQATESVNAGYPMAAAAIALGVRLEKPGAYVLCPEHNPPRPGDVERAVELAARSSALASAIAGGAGALLHLLHLH